MAQQFADAAHWAVQWGAAVLDKDWFLGAIVGGMLTYIGQWRMQKYRRRDQRRLAVMVTATQLRQWIITSTRGLAEGRLSEDSDGAFGHRFDGFPEFPFRDSLDQVAHLGPRDAQEVLALIEHMETIRSDAASTADLVDPTEAYMELRARGAALVMDSLALYERLAVEVGWRGATLDECQLAMLKEEQELQPHRGSTIAAES